VTAAAFLLLLLPDVVQPLFRRGPSCARLGQPRAAVPTQTVPTQPWTGEGARRSTG